MSNALALDSKVVNIQEAEKEERTLNYLTRYLLKAMFCIMLMFVVSVISIYIIIHLKELKSSRSSRVKNE